MDESDIPEWGIVELMGHRRLAGRLSEATIAGAVMLRIDVPAPGDDETAFTTQFYGGASIYCLTPTDEETARYVAQREQPEPIPHWEIAAKVRELAAQTDEHLVPVASLPAPIRINDEDLDDDELGDDDPDDDDPPGPGHPFEH